MQINSNYSMNGVLYETRRKQDNIPQFSTECVTQENENINPYMAEADFDEKAFGMILFTDEGMINTVDENVTPGISVQAPAPAVSSVKVVAAQIKSDGYVYVTVQVAGYGKNIYAISVI